MSTTLTDKNSNGFPARSGVAAGDFISSAEMNQHLDALGERTNYLYTMGIYPHNATFNYPIGAFCQVNGTVYRAQVENVGKPPASNPSFWVKCPMTKDEIIADVNLGSYATTAQMNTGLSSKQNTDATLTALANLTTAADQIPYATGADTFAMTPLTPFARTLLDDANAAAALSTLGAAPAASPALTGTPTAPTATSGTSTTQLATTAFVVAEMANSRPYEVTASSIKMDGAQSVGSLNTVARGDHVHPTDTSRAPLASPALTGTPTAPTASTGTRSTQLATTAFVGAESQIAAPVGSVYTFAGATVPTGWLKCNGALLSRTTYASLFAVIGTTYGAGDGSTTFALPDLRGEFVRGADDGRGVDAGRVLGSAQAGQNASHTHTASTSPAGGHSHVFEHLARMADQDRGIGNASLWSIDSTVTQTTSAVGDHIHAVTVNADGGNESRPRNVAMHYIIKY